MSLSQLLFVPAMGRPWAARCGLLLLPLVLAGLPGPLVVQPGHFHLANRSACAQWCRAMPCCQSAHYTRDGRCLMTRANAVPPGGECRSGTDCFIQRTEPVKPAVCSRSTKKIKICWHTNHINERGTERANFDWAYGAKHLLGHQVKFITAAQVWAEGNRQVRTRFVEEFGDFAIYDGRIYDWVRPVLADGVSMANKVREEGCHLFFTQKHGEGGSAPQFDLSGAAALKIPFSANAIFVSNDMHGNSFSAISGTLSHSGYNCPVTAHVPYPVVIQYKKSSPDRFRLRGDLLRKRLGIPDSAVVLCRHGARDTFNIRYAVSSVAQWANEHPSLHFILANTQPVIPHPRVHHLPAVLTQQARDAYFSACDGMYHARNDGETFGMAVGEMSLHNRPVITCSAQGAMAHVKMLGSKGVYYRDVPSLRQAVARLVGLGREGIHKGDWRAFTEYGMERVTALFDKVFIQPALEWWERIEGLNISDPWSKTHAQLPSLVNMWRRGVDPSGEVRPCARYTTDERLPRPGRSLKEARDLSFL